MRRLCRPLFSILRMRTGFEPPVLARCVPPQPDGRGRRSRRCGPSVVGRRRRHRAAPDQPRPALLRADIRVAHGRPRRMMALSASSRRGAGVADVGEVEVHRAVPSAELGAGDQRALEPLEDQRVEDVGVGVQLRLRGAKVGVDSDPSRRARYLDRIREQVPDAALDRPRSRSRASPRRPRPAAPGQPAARRRPDEGLPSRTTAPGRASRMVVCIVNTSG